MKLLPQKEDAVGAFLFLLFFIVLAAAGIRGVMLVADAMTVFFQRLMTPGAALFASGVILLVLVAAASVVTYLLVQKPRPRSAIRSDLPDELKIGLLAADAARAFVNKNPQKSVLIGLATGIVLGANPDLARALVKTSKKLTSD